MLIRIFRYFSYYISLLIGICALTCLLSCEAASSNTLEPIDTDKIYIQSEKILTLKAETNTKPTTATAVSIPSFNVTDSIEHKAIIPFAFANSANNGQTAEISIPIKFENIYTHLSKVELQAILYDSALLSTDEEKETVPISIKHSDEETYKTVDTNGVILKTWTATQIDETVKITLKGDFTGKTKTYEGKLGLVLKAYSKDNPASLHIPSANIETTEAIFTSATLKGTKLRLLFDILGYLTQDFEFSGKISSKLELETGFSLDEMYVNGRTLKNDTVFTLEKPGYHHIYYQTKNIYTAKTFKKSIYFKIKDPEKAEEKTRKASPKTISGKKVIGYYTNWSQYSRKERVFKPENIDPSLYTHIIYAFADIQYGTKTIPDGKGDCIFPNDSNPKCQFRIKPFEWNDIKSHTVDVDWTTPQGHMIDVINLKEKNTDLNVLISVGGWNFNDKNYNNLGTHRPDSAAWIFSTMISSEKYRKQFIDNVVKFCLDYGFDGIDLDWEYPGVSDRNDYSKIEGLNHTHDKANFVALIKEMRNEFNKHDLLLSIAVYGANKAEKLNGYDIAQLHPHLDWIGLMSYDYHGGFDLKTYAHTPLETELNNGISVKDGVEFWLNAGVPANKLILGFATYGRGWKDVATKGYKITANGPSLKGNFVAENGILPYYEIKTYLENGYMRYWDDATKTPYIYHSTKKELISYDDKQSYSHKVDYLKSKNLGGAMIWAIDFDYFLDSDGAQKNELQKYLNEELRTKGSQITTLIDTSTQETANSAMVVPNTPPIITSIAPTTATEGVKWTYQVVAIDNESTYLNYYMEKKPAGMKMDFSYNISWIPDGAKNSEEIIIKVTDEKQAEVKQTFIVNIEQVNDAPIFISTPPKHGKVGVQYTYKLKAKDEDGDSLSYSLGTAPSGMIISGDTVTWTPAISQENTNTALFKVSDGTTTTEQTVTITVVGAATELISDDTSLFEFSKTFGSPNKFNLKYIGTDALSLRGATFKFKFSDVMTDQNISYTGVSHLSWLTLTSTAADKEITVSIEEECPAWAKDMSLNQNESLILEYYRWDFSDPDIRLKEVILPNKNKGEECTVASSSTPTPTPSATPSPVSSGTILDTKTVNFSDVLANEQAVLNANSNWLLVKDAIRTISNEIVDNVSIGSASNPENVKRVESFFTQEKWNEIFAEAHPYYSYLKFLKAVAKFPAICQTYPVEHCESKSISLLKHNGIDSYSDCSELICRKTLGTMFSHFAQETGGHSETGVPYDEKVKEWKEGLVHVEEMGYPPNTPGYNTECIAAYNDQSTATYKNKKNIVWQSWRFPCPESGGSYYGRGAKQLSYNYNYGAFSEAMYDGDVTKLLNEPRLVAETWLNLASALFFYVYPQPPKPSMLHVLDGTWQPNTSDINNGLKPGFGSTIMIINGGVECGGIDDIAQGKNRISYYKNFAKYFDFNIPEDEVLGCKAPMKSFHDTGAGAIKVYWDTDWSGVGKCKLVGYQTPHSAFKEGDYARCVMQKIPAGTNIQKTNIIDDVADKDPPKDFIDDWVFEIL